jgi:plasmid stability protein
MEPLGVPPMATLTIKGLPDRIYRDLKRRAEEQRRSLNREIIICLERSCDVEPFDPKEWLAKTDALRKRLGLTGLSDAQVRAEKRRGRP